MVTRRSLWEYCQINPTHSVTYIHPKGSFHPSEGNSEWRRSLTDTALDEKCLDPPDKRCNVCGGGFQTAWGPLFLGNMWTARCSYVKKLISPFEVEDRYTSAFQNKPSLVVPKFYRYLQFSIPKGRYAAEAFIGTHPNIVPCTLDKNQTFTMVPLGKFPANIGPFTINFNNVVNHGGHRREWFLLPGLLWRSHFIYNELPPDDSWIWWYFPEGDKLRQLLENHTVSEAIAIFANSSAVWLGRIVILNRRCTQNKVSFSIKLTVSVKFFLSRTICQTILSHLIETEGFSEVIVDLQIARTWKGSKLYIWTTKFTPKSLCLR